MALAYRDKRPHLIPRMRRRAALPRRRSRIEPRPAAAASNHGSGETNAYPQSGRMGCRSGQVRQFGCWAARAGRRHEAAVPEIRRITLADIRYALARGIDDFAAFRSDVVFLVVHLSAGRPRAGAVELRVRSVAAAVPARLGLRADRPDRRGRPLRDEPAPRGRSRARVGRCLRRVPLAGDRLDRAVRVVAAGDLRGLDRRRERDLRFDARPEAAGLGRRPFCATYSRPIRAGR